VHGAVFANQGTSLIELWRNRGTNSVGARNKSGCRMIFEDELRRDRGTIIIGAGSLSGCTELIESTGAVSRLAEQLSNYIYIRMPFRKNRDKKMTTTDRVINRCSFLSLTLFNLSLVFPRYLL
jgi:hypothetical protein